MPMSTTKIANSERQFAQAIHCQSFVKLPQSQQVVLQVKDGSMHFGQRLLWQDVNFSILSGEFVALLGANGTGKTTLLRSLLKLVPLSSGSITLGKDIRVGYVPQLYNGTVVGNTPGIVKVSVSVGWTAKAANGTATAQSVSNITYACVTPNCG